MFNWQFINLACSTIQSMFFTKNSYNTRNSYSTPIITGNPDYYSYCCDTNEDAVSQKFEEVRAKAQELGINSSSPLPSSSTEKYVAPGHKVNTANFIKAYRYEPAIEERDRCKEVLESAQENYDKALKKSKKKKINKDILNNAEETLNTAKENYKKACNKVFLIERILKVYEFEQDLSEYNKYKNYVVKYNPDEPNPEKIYEKWQERSKAEAKELTDMLNNSNSLDSNLKRGSNFENVLDVMFQYKEINNGRNLLSDIMANEVLKETYEKGKGEVIFYFVMSIVFDSPIKDSAFVKKIYDTYNKYEDDNLNKNLEVFTEAQINELNILIENCYSEIEEYRKSEAEKLAKREKELIIEKSKTAEATIKEFEGKYANNVSVMMGDLLSLEDRSKYLQEAANNHKISPQNESEEYDNGNGKFDTPSEQQQGTCWIHATLRSMMATKQGAEYLNSLIYKSENGNIACYIPEADAIDEGEGNANGIYAYNQKEICESKTLYSDGDGDFAAYINACNDYWSTYEIGNLGDIYFNKVEEGVPSVRGFELITGRKAVFYQYTKEIPLGVACTVGTSEANYNNIKKLFEGDKAAFMTGFEFPDKVTSAVYVKSNDHTTIDNAPNIGKPFISNHHAYAVVGIDDNYIYLEESNNPGKHIRINKDEFIASAMHVSSYRWE